MSDTTGVAALKGREKEVGEKVEELGQAKAGEFYGIKSRSTFRDFLYRNNLPTKKAKKAKIELSQDEESELAKAEQRIKELQKEVKEAQQKEIFSERVADVIENAVISREPKYKPKLEIVSSRPKDKHTFALLWSDQHAGEKVSYAETNGINEYDWDIMLKRHDKLRESLISFQENRPYPIEELRLWMLGDGVSGNIHPELVETNEIPLAEAAVQFIYDASEWVESLTEYFPKIVVEGVIGNHARFTEKSKSKQAHDSVDWMIYHGMNIALKKNERVDFNIPYGSMLPTMVYDRWRSLLWHGDGVRSSMPGVPWGGVTRRVHSLQNQFMTIGQPIDLFCVGHFHTANFVTTPAGKVAMNGSVVGANEYSMKQFGGGDPPQQMLLTFHPRHGLTDQSIIDLEDTLPLGER